MYSQWKQHLFNLLVLFNIGTWQGTIYIKNECVEKENFNSLLLYLHNTINSTYASKTETLLGLCSPKTVDCLITYPNLNAGVIIIAMSRKTQWNVMEQLIYTSVSINYLLHDFNITWTPIFFLTHSHISGKLFANIQFYSVPGRRKQSCWLPGRCY